MFRHKHKHPAFKALRDTVAFVVLCVALQGYVARTDGAEAAAAFRTVWPTLAVYCAGGALLVYCAGAAALPLRVSAIFSAMGMALQVSLHRPYFCTAARDAADRCLYFLHYNKRCFLPVFTYLFETNQ